VRTLETVGAKVIGTVMNNVKVSGSTSTYSYGDYKYGY
jgi:ethanolamine utilization protein EutA (predicted chaperonin)